MKIAVGVSGYNSRKEIPRLLDPIYKHVDLVICGDGKYELFEGEDYSSDGWLEYCEKTYHNTITYKYAGKQTDKRQKYLDIAGEQNCDYLIVMDTDDYIHPEHQDWNQFYKELEQKSKWTFPEPDGIIEPQIFWMLAWIPSSDQWQRAHNKVKSNSWKKYVRIHKNPGQQRYSYHSHFQWSPKSITDYQIAKWEVTNKNEPTTYGESCPYLFRPFMAIDGIRFTTNSQLRTTDQLSTRENWAWDNMFEECKKQYEECCKADGIPMELLPI